MSDSGSANSNSWTLLSQEENVATLRPLAEATEHHGDSSTSGCNAESQPQEGATPVKTEHPVENQQALEEPTAGLCEVGSSPGIAQHPAATHSSDPSPTLIPPSETPPSLVIPTHSLHGNDAHSQSEGLPEGPVESSPEPDSFSDSYTHISPSSIAEPPVPELLGGLELTKEEEEEEEEEEAERPRSEEEESEQGPGLAQSATGSSVDPPVEEEKGRDDREVEEEVEVSRRSLLASLEQIGRTEEEDEDEEEAEEEFQLPRRDDDSGFSVNKCILGAVILLGLGTIFFSGVFMDLDEENDYTPRELKDTEQPVKQEWLKPEAPQAAVDEGTEILNKLVRETQQIAELQAKAQAQKEELNAAKGQAAKGAQEQLRRGKEEEKEEVVNGRLKKEMANLFVLQRENGRLERELESVPTLEKELEMLRTTVTECKLPTVSEASSLPPVPATTTPPAGQEGESRPATARNTEGQAKKPWQGEEVEKTKERKKEKHDMGEKEGKGEKNESRDRVNTARKDEERKKPKQEQQERSKEVKGWKQKEEWNAGKEQGDRKKEKGHRGDEGEPWKDRADGNEWRGREERKDYQEKKEWKKGKSEKLDDRDKERKGHEKKKKEGKDRGRKEWRGKDEERKEWKEEKEWKRGKEEKEWKSGKDERKDRKEEREWKKEKSDKLDHDHEKERRGHEEEKKDGKGRKEHGKGKQEKEEWKGEKEWKKRKDVYKESGKEWKDKREWREKGEQKEWKKDTDRRGKNNKDHGREQKGKEERKAWEGKEERKAWEGKEERKAWEGKEERKAWEGKEERKPWEGKEGRNIWEGRDRPGEGRAKKEAWKEERKDADWKKDGKQIPRRKEDDDHKKQEQHHHHDHHRKEPLWQSAGDGKPTHTHRRPAFGQPDYWLHQRERLRQNALPSRHCDTVETCAQAEGTLPVQLSEFEALLAGYLAKAEEGAGVDTSAGEELRKLAAEFFKDGMFVHDQMSFRDYVEDVADILEDMVDGDESEEEKEEEEEEGNSDLEDEMEMFGKEVMKRFAVERSSEKEQRKTGKSTKENERGRG